MSQQRKITHVIDMLIIFKYKIFKIIAASNNGFQTDTVMKAERRTVPLVKARL